jgi:hypothetical protein
MDNTPDDALDAMLRAADEDMLAAITRVFDLAKGLAQVRQRCAVPALVRGRDIGRTASSIMDTSELLVVPGRDLRAMNRGRREETRVLIRQLREQLWRCPAGTFGIEALTITLTRVATVSEILTADRDERAALRLIEAAAPQLKILGRHHPAVFQVRRARANALYELGQYRWAEAQLRQLSEDERRVFGADDPRTALLLLWAQVNNDRLPEAETGFGALEARLVRTRGASTPMRWHLDCRYSWLLGQQGLVSESARSYQSVIVNRAHELGADHSEAMDARHSQGKVLVVNGYGPLAVPLLQALAEDRAAVLGDRHPDTLETLKYLHLARVDAEPRDDRVLDSAIDALEQILRLQDSRHGAGYPMSRDTAEQLGKLLHLREANRSREQVVLFPTPREVARL